MDEDERNKKLKAGKEKLAAFQKKKSKKRHHGERTGNHKNTEPVESSSVELSSSSEVPFLDDSDQVLTSEDEMNTRDTKTIFKIETKLKHATERIAELEESLEGKQLALNRVIEENAKLKVVAVQDKIVEMESALSKRDEIIRQLTTRLQSTIALESEAEVLTQQVQQLQSQLINAGKLMESQNSKQMMSSQALLEAKNEIVTLQSCLQDKDSLLNQLSDKVTAISSEYVSLKSSYDTFKQHSDNGGFGRPGIATVSGPDQTHDLEVKVQEIRLQLEENYRNQISLMKEELVKQYGTERDSLNSEIYRLQEKCSELEIEREKFLQDKHVPDSSQENSDPRTKLQDLKAKLIEIQNEKDKLMQENVALNNQLTTVEEKLTMTIDNMSKNALDNGVGVQDESDLVNELKEKNSALLLEVESYKKDLDETRKQMTHLQQKSRGLAKFQVDSQEIVMELKQVTEQYEEALVNIALMKGKIEDYDIKCEDLTEDLEKLKKKLETSDELVREYEEKMKDYELMKGNVENTKEQMKSFDEKIVNYESKIKELVEDVKIWKNKCEEVEKQRKDFDSKVVNLEKEVEIARKQNEEYCDKFVDYEQQLTDYEGLMTQFNELQHECNVYQTQNDDLNNKINIQQDVVVELKAEIEILANQNQMFQEQTLLQTQCVEKLTIENKSLQEVVELHKSQVDQLTQALNQSTSEVNLYQEKACSLESAVKSLEKELQTKYSHEKLKEKDEIIKKLSEEVGELTAQMKVLYSENGQFQKETVGREETTPLNESFNEASSLSNFQEHLENKIEQSVATTLTLEFLSQSGQQEVTDSQSNDALQNQMLSQPEREMDADSLDGGESTHTLDSLEPTRENDLSSQISEKNATIQSLMQEVSRLKAESISITEQKQTVENLTAQITDLEDRNNKLENWNADLLDQINELSVKAEKHNAELSVNMESSDEDTLVQTFRLQIDSLHEEKSKLQESNLLLEKSVTNQNETLKSTEAMLATLEREKLALHNELTIVNDVIEEFSQREELSQNREKGSVELSYDSTCISSSMCNKLKLFQSKLTSNMDDYELLKSECETMLSDKQEIQDKLDTLLLENESLCSQIKEIEKENQTLKSAAENQEQVKKLSDCNHAAPSQLEDVNEELHQAHIEIEQLKNSFEAASEKEQILQSQVLRLSEQISHLSAINQAVSGDKENLENRFVEATHSEATGSNQANENQVRTSHDFVSPSQNDAQTSNQSRDLLGNIDVMKCSKLHDLSLTNHDEESQAGIERSDDGTDVSVGQSSSSVQQVEDDAEDISEDQTMLEALKKQYETQLDSLRHELESERQARVEKMETQPSEDQLEKLDTAEKEKMDEIISALNVQHAADIDSLQQKYLEDVDLKVKAMRFTLEQIYTGQLDMVKTELEKKQVQSLKDLNDQLTREHEEDIQRIERLWEQRLEDLEEQHAEEMNKSLLEESLTARATTAAQIQKTIRRMAQEHEQLLQNISEGLSKTPRISTPKKVRQNQEQQTDDEAELSITEEENSHIKEKIPETTEDVRVALENQREELDQLRGCLLQEYEQLLATRTDRISDEAQEIEKLQAEMEQLQRLYNKQKAKLKSGGQQISDFSKLKEQYENKISSLENFHKEEILQYKEEIDKLKQEVGTEKRDSGSNVVTSSGVPDEQESERDYIRNTYSMTVISDDSLQFDDDETSQKSLQELKTLLAKKEDEISDLQLKLSQDNIEIQELQFKLTEHSDKIQEHEKQVRVNQAELDEANSQLSDKECKIDTLMKQKQALGEKCLRELEESENKHAKIVTEINEKFEKVLSDLKLSQAEVTKLKAELEASLEQERMLEEQYDELQQQQKAALKKFQERADHDNEETVSELKLAHEKELESLKAKHKEDLDSLSEKHQSDIESIKQELENSYQEQLDELQHQQKQKIESVRQDMDHERQVEIGMLQTEFKVQLEVEKKRFAADLTSEHENECKKLKEEYEQTINNLQSSIESSKGQAVQNEGQGETGHDELESPVEEETEEETMEKAFSPRGEKFPVQEDEESLISDTPSQETVIEVSKSEEDTVKEVRPLDTADKTENDGESLESDKSDKDIKDRTLSEPLLQTDQSQDFDQVDTSQDFDGRVDSSAEWDMTASSRDFTQTASTLSATSSDSSEKDLSPGKTHDNTVAVLMQEIEKAKAETVKQLQKEYTSEINQLSEKLNEALEKNSELENAKIEFDKLIEDHESKLKEEVQKASKEEVEKQNLLRQKLVKEHEENVSTLNKEYEEKMELLRQELMETFEAEKEDIKKQHQEDLNEAEEKYDTLIDRIKSGEAPEVAEIIHERYDTELEMAKSLMQQEFDETLESEQARFEEEQQELMDKLVAERQAEAEELKIQHEKDIAECRQTIIQEYEVKITELEQNQESEISRLKEEMAKIVPLSAEEVQTVEAEVKVEPVNQEPVKEEEVEEIDLPSDPETARRRSSADKDDSIEDLRETHTAIIARIEAEYEQKLQRIKEEMASSHSDDIDGGSVDTVISRKSIDQHKQELLALEEHLSEKHQKEIQNLQTQNQARIQEIEEKYKKEIGNLKKILEFLQHSSSSEDTIQGQLASPAQTVPTLEGLEEEIVPVDSGRYVPSRSTPRDDMESIDRTEETVRVKRPTQISPRDKKEIQIDESPEEPLINFDTPKHQKPEEDAGSEISEEPILPSSAPPRELSASSFDFDAGLDVKAEFEDEDDYTQSFEDEKTESYSGRSTPQDLIQTQALADTLADFKPVATYESGELPVSSDVVKHKDGRIKELEDEVTRLTQKLQDQIEEERLILMRREKESQEGQNLELMLKSDLERVNTDRESVQRTNEQLLQLLSDSVKTYLNVEDSINKKLAKMVAEGDRSTGSKGRSPPKDQDRSPPAGAEGGEESEIDTSVLSNVTDEGLDLSQRISESIFQGPELDKDGEEMLKDASQRLQGSVSRLLEMIEETTNQLLEARNTQHQLVDHVTIREQDSNQMTSQVQELQDQLREEIQAKEYLAVELHKAEGLIEGYSTERETLNQQIADLEEKKEALVLELETTKNKLQDLESIHHEAVSLRAELQRQQSLLQGNMGEEAQVSMATEGGRPSNIEALLLEVNRLNDDKRDLQQQVRELQDKYEGRVRDLQNAGEETERHYLQLLEEKKVEIVDLQLQVDSVEKQLKSNKQFIESSLTNSEQTAEREQEIEDYQKEINRWKQEALSKNKANRVEGRLQQEVDELTEELQDHMNNHSAYVEQTEKLQRDLREKKLTTEELNILVRQLELEIEDKNIKENILKQKVSSLEEELQKYEVEEDSEEELSPSDEGRTTDQEGNSRQVKGHRRRRLLPSHVSVKQEEELIHEKEALQKQVEDQMKQISALKNQLDEMRQRRDYGEDTQASTLQRQLEREKELLEQKEQKVSEMQVQIEDLEDQLSKKEHHILQLTAKTPVEELTNQYDDKVSQLERENEQLLERVKSLQTSTSSDVSPFTQTLLDEKNQEIDHLNDQVHQLQEELNKLTSGEEVVNLRDQVEKLQSELERRNFDFVRASHQSDGSFTDTEMPSVSASFAEKTSLQQELQDSVTDQINQISSLQQEVEQLKSSLTQREDQITALKAELKVEPPAKTEEQAYLGEVLQEKEAYIEQLNIQMDGLNSEVESLTDFQNKLQEDFDMVQGMLEEKEKEIDMLTQELTQKPTSDEAIVKLELDMAKLRRDLAEKDNVIEEKAEEMYMLNEKLEQQEASLEEMKDLQKQIFDLKNEKDTLENEHSDGGDDKVKVQLAEKEAELAQIKQEAVQKEAEMTKMKEELDAVSEHLKIAENLQRKLEEAGMLGPNILLREKDEEIKKLKDEINELKKQSESLAESDEQLMKNKDEIAKLKEELASLRQQVKDDRTEELRISHEEIGALRQRLKSADNQEGIQILTDEIHKLRKNMRPEDVAEVIKEQEDKIEALKCQSALLQHQLDQAYSQEEMDAKENMIQSLQMDLAVLSNASEQETKTNELQALSLQSVELDFGTESGIPLESKQVALQSQIPMRLVEEEGIVAEMAGNVYTASDAVRQLEARDHEISRLREELAFFKDSYDSGKMMEDQDVVLQEKEEKIIDLHSKIEIRDDQLRTKDEVIEQLKFELDNAQQQLTEVKSAENNVLQAKSEEIETLQSQLVTFESKIDEYAHIKDELDQYQTELTQKENRIQELEENCSRLRERLQGQEEQAGVVERLEAELKEKEIFIQDLEDECNNLRLKLKDQDVKMQEELQKASSFDAGDDIFAQLQEKQAKLEQTSKELSSTFAKLKDTENQLEQMEDVKQRLKEAVQLSEQQLQIVEQKDEEYMRLKLEIQEMVAEKDKAMKDLKQELQQVCLAKEQEVLQVTEQAEEERLQRAKVIDNLQQQVAELQTTVQPGGAGDAMTSVSQLKVQLQENENIMIEMHGELETVKSILQEKSEELDRVRGQMSHEKVQIEEATQGQLDQLRHELHVAKTALDEMQREGGWRNSREASVEREGLRSEHLDSDDELEGMDRLELVKEIKELRKDLKTALSELDLFRSTVSLSAKDYVRKVMELREELSQQHQKHIQNLQDRTRQDSESNLAQLRIRYEEEIDHIKNLHHTELEKKMGEVRRDMEKAHNQEMDRVMAHHQQELELARIQEPVLSDTMTMEAGRRLQSEISLSEKLDNRLLQSLQKQPEGADNVDTSTGVSSTEMTGDENVSSKLQMLMNRLHREGVQMLSISELQFLNRHMSPTQIEKEVDVESLKTSWESEKQSLLSAIQSLKDLLAQTHKLRGLEKGPDVSDWRGELLQAISYVFAKERDTLLAELRSHVLSHPTEELSDIQKLEQKIRNQEEHQKASLDQIFKADRQSMLAEIRDLRAHANISTMKHQEEREKMSEQLSTIEDQTTKKERQAKRQVQLLEYKLQQEKILQDDVRSRYDMECERNSELSTQLSREKNSNLDLQTELSNQQVQISKLKEALEREQSRFVSVSGALDEEKGKSHYLSELLEAERIKFQRLQVQLDDIRVSTEPSHPENLVEGLKNELMTEREKRIQVENTYELDQMTISTLRQELDKEQKNFHNMVMEYENKLQQLAMSMDLEKSRASDLERELEREKYMTARLKQNLNEERDASMESADREKGIYDEIQMELETEKARNLDLQRSLDREKKRNNDLLKSMDEEKMSLREELDTERQACRQLKNEMDQAQLQKLDITRHYEHERDQLNRVKVERDQLRNDLKAMKERENERERQRDNEKIADKRASRQVERERDDFKLKLHESDLEMQRLKQKILDLEENITVLREKELDLMRDFEQEKLRSLHNQSLDREMLSRADGCQESDIESMEQRDNWKVYKAQLESLCQSLQYQMLQFQDKLGQLGLEDNDDASSIQSSVKDLLGELRHVQIPLTFESGANRNLMSRPDLNAVNGRILHHNNELTNFVSRLTEEKIELRKTLGKLEEEVYRYRQREKGVQQNGDQTPSNFTDRHLEDKAEWAKERLSLQLSLNNAERQIEQMQHDLKIERDRRSTIPTSGILSDHDKDKMQRLFGKYLRAESYRKALIYQKKYLLLLLGGFQDCEQTTLALIARMGAFPSPQDMQPRTSHGRLFTIFRSAARVVVAISRMKFLVNKWRRATRVGSPVAIGSVDTQQGYMPTSASYSPHTIHNRSSSSPLVNVNGLHRMSPHVTQSPRVRTTSSPHPTSLGQRHVYGSPALGYDVDFLPSTSLALNGRASPYGIANGHDSSVNGILSKDYSSRSSPSLQTSGARRKLLSTPLSSPKVNRESPKTSRDSPSSQRRVRIAEDQSSVHDSYIQRLENLQMKLGSIDSESPRRKSPWR